MMKKEKKPLKEQKYNVVYWPVDMLEQRTEVYDLLLDIDCNYSRFLQSILHNLADICRLIISVGKNYRHYDWHLLIIDKESGDGYSSLMSGNYKLTNLVERKKANDRADNNTLDEDSISQ